MTAEDRFRNEIAKCRRCEACRELVDSACLVFAKMFSLADEERDSGQKIGSQDLDVKIAGVFQSRAGSDVRAIRTGWLRSIERLQPT